MSGNTNYLKLLKNLKNRGPLITRPYEGPDIDGMAKIYKPDTPEHMQPYIKPCSLEKKRGNESKKITLSPPL